MPSSCGWHGPRYALTRWGDGYICRNDELCFARYKLHLDDELWHRLHGPDEVSVATVDGVQLYVRRDVAQNREFAEVSSPTRSPGSVSSGLHKLVVTVLTSFTFREQRLASERWQRRAVTGNLVAACAAAPGCSAGHTASIGG